MSQPLQPALDVPLPEETKEETVSATHIRASSGGERGVDPVKMENIGGGASRQAGGPPGQGYSKYQKSLPPRFQRQQQVRICTYVANEFRSLYILLIPTYDNHKSYVLLQMQPCLLVGISDIPVKY